MNSELKPDEYLEELDELPGQFKQLKISSGLESTEPIYQEVNEETVKQRSDNQAYTLVSESRHASPFKSLKNLVRTVKSKLIDRAGNETKNASWEEKSEDRTSVESEFVETPAVSPIGPFDGNIPEFLKEYQHIYENVEHSEIRQEISDSFDPSNM